MCPRADVQIVLSSQTPPHYTSCTPHLKLGRYKFLCESLTQNYIPRNNPAMRSFFRESSKTLCGGA